VAGFVEMSGEASAHASSEWCFASKRNALVSRQQCEVSIGTPDVRIALMARAVRAS
jgi:hypothetical protein